MNRHPSMLRLGTILCFATASVGAADEIPPLPVDPLEKVHYDRLEPDGRLTGGVVRMAWSPIHARNGAAAPVTTILSSGSSANRVDFVFVGDGYTAEEMALYDEHVRATVGALFLQEPFATYAPYFNVYRVDVVSNESGVDNDPTPGVLRDTALDMRFWCNGIERLLCVDIDKAYSAAQDAPGIDQLLAVANSKKYGGAGYRSSDVTTLAGGLDFTGSMAAHELGHSLGSLEDEYVEVDGYTWTGEEPPEPNISAMSSATMAAVGGKWAAWLGYDESRFDGLIETFEGAAGYEFGLYRATRNSKMRSLLRPYNLPSAQALLLEIYRLVHPIDDHATTAAPLNETSLAWVRPLAPVGRRLDVSWRLDGEVIAGATGDTLSASKLSLAPGRHELAVTVVDTTPWVRDEAARAQWMTQEVRWTMEVSPASVHLEAAFPNPALESASIRFELSEPQRVHLSVVDVAGRAVRTLVQGESAAGWHVSTWDGRNDAGRLVSAGRYWFRFTAPSHHEVRSVVLLR